MDDSISRQAAIDALIKRDANCGIDSAKVIEELPSAQPEIVRCKDCSQYIYGSDEECFYCRITGIVEQEEFFCGDAERRTDGSD